MKGRVLSVDPGSKRIGIAISDPLRIIATPLVVIPHTRLEKDCEAISRLCLEHEVTLVIIGQALSSGGETIPQTRHAQKVASMLGEMLTIPIELWDESGSTKQAWMAKLRMGASRKKRTGHLDDHAAAAILQSYLDAQNEGWESK